MARTTIIVGTLLILLGLGFYVGIGLTQGSRPSVTALIPALAGVPILSLGLVATREAHRRWAMHAVAVLSLIGFLLPVSRLGMQLAEGASIKGTVLASLVSMVILCGFLFLRCLQSFLSSSTGRSVTERWTKQ